LGMVKANAGKHPWVFRHVGSFLFLSRFER